MSWLNEPADWSHTGDILTVRAEPETDFWRTTHYGFVRDSGHFLATGELGLRFRGDLAHPANVGWTRRWIGKREI